MPRQINEIAADIRKEWKNVNFAAKPYLDAMMMLRTIDDKFLNDDASSIILYFLSNASGFRGGNAKALKQELKDLSK